MQRNSEKINNSLGDIPGELLLLILIQLDPFSLIYLLQTNQHFRTLISFKLNILWQEHFLKQLAITINPSKKTQNPLSSLFITTYKFSNSHLNKEERECFTLVCANDLYLIKNKKIEFDLELLEKHDSKNRSLISLIRKQNNPLLDRYVFNNIYQKSSDLRKEIILLSTAIMLNQDNDYLLSCLKGKNLNEIKVNKEPILCFAVTHNADRVVKLLLQLGTNPNCSDQETCSPLHIAARMGFLEIVNDLLAHQDIQVDALYKNKWTPLCMASREGHVEIVEALLKKGATVDGKEPKYYPLFIAMEERRTEVVACLLKYKANISIQAYGFPLIYVGAKNDHLAGLKSLVEYSQKYNITLDFEAIAHDNSTALYVAAQNGHAEVCQFLIDHGAKIDCKFHQFTPLYVASTFGHDQVVEVLCRASPKHSISPQEMFLIVASACENNSENIALYLLQEHPSYLDVNNSFLNNFFFLHSACQYGYLLFVKLLIKIGVKVDSKNKENETPLQIAASMGHKKIVDILLESGADPNCHFPNGDTIVNVVCAKINRYHLCLSIVNSLIKGGADLSFISSNMKIMNQRLAAIFLPALERLSAEDLSQVVYLMPPYKGTKHTLIASITEFIINEENIHQRCNDAKLCLNLLKNISTPFACAVILYALLAKNNNPKRKFFFNKHNDNPFIKCVTETCHFQSTFTAQNSFYVMIFASLGCNKSLLNLLKELVIEPIIQDAVTMSNDKFQAVMFCLNLFEAKIKKGPLLQNSVDEKKEVINLRMKR